MSLHGKTPVLMLARHVLTRCCQREEEELQLSVSSRTGRGECSRETIKPDKDRLVGLLNTNVPTGFKSVSRPDLGKTGRVMQREGPWQGGTGEFSW